MARLADPELTLEGAPKVNGAAAAEVALFGASDVVLGAAPKTNGAAGALNAVSAGFVSEALDVAPKVKGVDGAAALDKAPPVKLEVEGAGWAELPPNTKPPLPAALPPPTGAVVEDTASCSLGALLVRPANENPVDEVEAADAGTESELSFLVPVAVN